MCWTSLSTGLSEWELGPHHAEWSPIDMGAELPRNGPWTLSCQTPPNPEGASCLQSYSHPWPQSRSRSLAREARMCVLHTILHRTCTHLTHTSLYIHSHIHTLTHTYFTHTYIHTHFSLRTQLTCTLLYTHNSHAHFSIHTLHYTQAHPAG